MPKKTTIPQRREDVVAIAPSWRLGPTPVVCIGRLNTVPQSRNPYFFIEYAAFHCHIQKLHKPGQRYKSADVRLLQSKDRAGSAIAWLC